MSINLKSEYLKKYISSVLGKGIDETDIEDLDKIDFICLKKMDVLYHETDCVTSDLMSFQNLGSCTLFQFKITKDDINVLKSIPNLKSVCFDFCDLQMNDIHDINTVSNIYFNKCRDINLNQLKNSNFKNIVIIGNEKQKDELDVQELGKLQHAENISIHNYVVKNINMLENIAPNLKWLNLDGTIVDSDELEKLNGRIQISHRADFLLIP